MDKIESIRLIASGYNSNKGKEKRKEGNEEIKRNINKRWEDQQRVTRYFSKGYEKDYEEDRGKPPVQTDIEEMSALQLIDAGHKQLEEKRKEEEKETTKTINFNEE